MCPGRTGGSRAGVSEQRCVLDPAFPVPVAVYLLPTLVGLVRRVDALGLVFLVSLIGAPTGVGWLGAVILAFGPPSIRAS